MLRDVERCPARASSRIRPGKTAKCERAANDLSVLCQTSVIGRKTLLIDQPFLSGSASQSPSPIGTVIYAFLRMFTAEH